MVDTSGIIKVHLKGDHSTIHTKDSAFRKAYTVVTMGPIFGFDRTSAFAKTVSENPAGASSALFSLPDIIALSGGVAIKRGNEIVARPKGAMIAKELEPDHAATAYRTSAGRD